MLGSGSLAAVFVSGLILLGLQPCAWIDGLLAHTGCIGDLPWNATDGDQLVSLAVTADGEQLITAISDGTLSWWQVSERRLTKDFKLTSSKIEQGSIFSADGRFFAAQVESNTQLVQVYDVSGEQPSLMFSVQNFVLAFSQSGRFLAVKDNAGISLRNVSNKGSLVNTLPQKKDVYAVVFSPDDQLIALGLSDESIEIWRVSNGTLEGQFGSKVDREAWYSWYSDMEFSPDGRRLASSLPYNSATGFSKPIVQVWDMNKLGTGGSTIESSLFPSYPQQMSLFPSFRQQTLPYWATLGKLAFSPDGHSLAIGLGSYASLAEIWEPNIARVSVILPGSTYHFDSHFVSDQLSETSYGFSDPEVAFANGGHTLITAPKRGPIRLWRVP